MAIKFVDRVPTRPGRIKITPENGTAPWYGVMERADEPSVEGTPINATNLNAMQQNQGLSANMRLYVDTSGSDSLGSGTSSAPYATITKALSMIPKALNGYSAVIDIKSGTYDEEVQVNGFSNGTIHFYSTPGNNVTISKLEITSTSHFQTTNGWSLHVLNGIIITNNAFAYIEANITCSGAARGVQVARGSKAIFTGTVTLNNTTEFAAFVTGANLVIATIAGSGNNTGIRATSGGVCAFVANSLTATVVFSTTSGGRIYSGAQTNIPNY